MLKNRVTMLFVFLQWVFGGCLYS